MNSTTILTLIVTAVTTLTCLAQENEKLHLRFRATCRTTTESGRLVTRVLTEREIIRVCAQRAGLGTTNLTRFMLIYDVDSHYNGDTIKVVRRSTGEPICTPFKVLFQRSITDWEGRRDERIAFMFNNENTDPMGSAVVVEKPLVRSDGSLGRNVITAKLQMYDEVYFPERHGIITGYFITGRSVSWD